MNSSLNSTVYCTYQRKNSGSYYTIVLKCAKYCESFPCNRFSAKYIQDLIDNDLLEYQFQNLTKRSMRMYLFKKGEDVVPAYEGFDPKNPKWDEMQGVDEVFYVSKVFVPQMKLVVKENVVQNPRGPKKSAKKNKEMEKE